MTSASFSERRWASAMIIALVASVCAAPPARSEAGGGPAGIWTPLARALRETTAQGVPSVVIITSRSSADCAALRRDLEASPQAEALARSVRLAEMPAEIYASQVAKLGVKSFPTVVVYREQGGKLQTVAAKAGLADARSLFAWLVSLDPSEDRPAEVATGRPGPKDPKVAQASHYNDGPSPQAYATEQRIPQPYAPPKQPPIAPPQPPAYIPPPQPQQPVYQAPPAQYVPAPPPTYLQTQPPAMVVQQAPQQIFFAPTPPPQVTVAMAPPMYAPQPQPMQAPQPNLFTQPMQAPQPQPVQAPQPQPMQAPQPQPMQAPQPQPMYAPQPMQAPQPQPMYAPQPQPMQAPVGQAPATAMVLQAPGLIDSLLGTIGENLARRKNPRVQMSPMPTLAQAPVANAPVAFAPAGQGQAYAQVTGYAPSGPPIPVITPEATSFAPCNTYGAHCKYHGAPCPGPNPGQGHGQGHGNGHWGGGGGGEYAPPSGPTPSPQNGGMGFRRWLGHGE